MFEEIFKVPRISSLAVAQRARVFFPFFLFFSTAKKEKKEKSKTTAYTVTTLPAGVSLETLEFPRTRHEIKVSLEFYFQRIAFHRNYFVLFFFYFTDDFQGNRVENSPRL